jgi:hypothetical protein
MGISKREFVSCPLYSNDVPREDCGGCEYNVRTASGLNRCGFCRLSKRDKRAWRLSERDDILREYNLSDEGED